jgi:hypothetical protein
MGVVIFSGAHRSGRREDPPPVPGDSVRSVPRQIVNRTESAWTPATNYMSRNRG